MALIKTMHDFVGRGVLAAALSGGALAQDAELDFALDLGGTSGSADGRDMTLDGSGNVYTAGYFSGTVDFDPGAGVSELTVAVGNNGYVTKFDADGNLIWVRQAGGGVSTDTYGVIVDGDGNVYTTGGFNFTQDFDPGAGVAELVSLGGEDIFVRKLDSDGNFVWVVQLGGDNLNRGFDIALDPSGNVLSSGIIYDDADFDPGPGLAVLSSMDLIGGYVSKLDGDGNFVWAKRVGSGTVAQPYAIGTDSAGNVYAAGSFSGLGDFDPSGTTFPLESAGGNDAFVLKLDPDGNFVWAIRFGGQFGEQLRNMKVDGGGSIYLVGDFFDTVDFDPGPGVFELSVAGVENSGGLEDVFVVKLNTNGELIWARNMGGNAADRGFGIDFDSEGNVYTTGEMIGSSEDYDPGPGVFNLSSAGLSDIFVSALDANGEFLWARDMGGSMGDIGRAVAVNTMGSVYATGQFRGTANFLRGVGTFNVTAAGAVDSFLLRLSQDGGTGNCGGREDINDDCNRNAVDVQLVINAALGIPLEAGLDADVNGDTQVNAVDVQLVINAALGLEPPQ